MAPEKRTTWTLALLALIVATTAVACGATPADVEVQAPTDRGPDDLPDGVTVSATGEVRGAPDTMTVRLGVSLERDTVQAAVDESTVLASALLDAAAAQGVAPEDVQTADYSINEVAVPREGQPPLVTGYRVTNLVTVRLRDLEAAGATIDAMTAAGGDATTLQSVAFTLEDDDEALAAARDDAMATAQAKATQLAEHGGRSLGPAEAISDTPLVGAPVTYLNESARFAADSATPIRPGEVTSTVTVRVRYSFT